VTACLRAVLVAPVDLDGPGVPPTNRRPLCPECDQHVGLTRTGRFEDHNETYVTGFIPGTDQPKYREGDKCRGSRRIHQATSTGDTK